MNPSSSKQENIKQRMKRTTRRLFMWTSFWVMSLAVLAFGPKFIWNYATSITLVAVVINLSMGYKMMMANIKHLNGLDEMQRKIQLEAMAMSLGVSVVFGAVYGLLEDIRLITVEPDPSTFLIVMSVSYLLGLAIFHRRYA